MKSRTATLRDAMARGVVSVGGLARAVYGTSPTNKKARRNAAKLRYYAMGKSRSVGGSRPERSAERAPEAEECFFNEAGSLNTPDVCRAVAGRGGFRKSQVRAALDAFCAVLAEALAAGRAVKYAGLGTFRPIIRKRRGEKEESYVAVRFRPAATVKRILNERGPERCRR